MNGYLAWAGILAIFLGVVHSVLGEILVFQKLRNKQNFSWVCIGSELPIRSIRILWTSWHLVTVFGIGTGMILLGIDKLSVEEPIAGFVKTTILIVVFVASLLVLFGTRGKHPGWVVLFIISMLIWVE